MRTSPRVFAIVIVLLACGDSTEPEPDPFPDAPYAVVQCPAFRLASTSGLPLQRITIGEVPGTFGSPVAAVLLDDDGEPYGLGYVLEGDGGALELSVPVHPVDPVDGGSVSLTFTDGTNACPAVDFVIDALPEAEGELAAVVGLLQDMVADQLAIVESTPEELRATPIEDVPASLWSLALVQALLDDPDDEESLLSISQRDPDDEALDLANRLLARTVMRASLESAALAVFAPAGSPPARYSSDDLTSAPANVLTPEGLSYCMELAVRLQRSASGLSREVARDIQQVFSDLGGGGNQLPLASEISVLFGAVFFIIYSEREAAGAVYPSRLTSISALVGEDLILEDDPSAVQITAEVTAASFGYNMQQQILDGISQAKALIDTYGDFNFSTGDPLVDNVAATLGQRFASRIGNVDIESLQIPADSFGPVTLRDPLWLDASVVAGDAVAIDGAHYVGRKEGEATISVRTEDGSFGDDQLADQVDVAVDDIRLEIFPDEVHVQYPEEQSFEVRVFDATYPDELRVDRDQPLQGTADDPVKVADGVYVVTYHPPENPNPTMPDFLVVENTATTGARQARPDYVPPRRLAQAVIRFGGLQITTSLPDCLDFGAPLQFEVELAEGIDPSHVRWSASAGDIGEETGAFVAPNEAATVEITAFLVDSPHVRHSVTVIVGCVCRGLLTVDGMSPQTTEVYFRVLEASGAIVDVGWVHDPVPDDGRSDAVSFEFATPVPFGETLQYEVHGGGFVPLGADLGIIVSSDETGPLLLTLSANEGGERVAGFVTGTVHASWKAGPEPGQDIVPLSFTFDVRADRFLSWTDGTVRYQGCLIGG